MLKALPNRANMESRLNIWVKVGEPLRQSDWEANCFEDLPAYIASLEAECKRGYKSQGLPAETGASLNLVTFGYIDPSNGEKVEVLTCADYADLPSESLIAEREKATAVEIITFA